MIIFLKTHFYYSLLKYQSVMDYGRKKIRACLKSTAVDSPTSLSCPGQ